MTGPTPGAYPTSEQRTDFLAGNLAEVGPMRRPIASRAGYQMKLDNRHGQRVNGTRPICRHVPLAQHPLSEHVEGAHQCPTAAIEPAL